MNRESLDRQRGEKCVVDEYEYESEYGSNASHKTLKLKYLYVFYRPTSIENLCLIEKAIRLTVRRERMKEIFDIFSVWFIYHLVNEIGTTTV